MKLIIRRRKRDEKIKLDRTVRFIDFDGLDFVRFLLAKICPYSFTSARLGSGS